MKKLIRLFLTLLCCIIVITASASASTIYPLPSSVSLNKLGGLELPVDIVWDSGWEAKMTIYAYDSYSRTDLYGLRAGDSIVISGRREYVYSANWEGDMLWINNNHENCYSFYDEYGTGVYTCMDAYYHTGSSAIGVIIIDPNIRFTCLDYLDYANMCSRDNPKVYASNDFIKMLKTDRAGFRKNYSYALFDANNLPQVIYRYYSAIETYN